MTRKDSFGIYPGKTAEQISLLRYSKSSCGVDFLLNTAESTEKRGWFDTDKRYKTDFFEFYFFRRAEGHLFLAGERVELHPGMVLVISPFQLQEWHVALEKLDYTFLVFQEEFVNKFLSDKYFMYRLLYCYQHAYPTWFDLGDEEARPLLGLLRRMKEQSERFMRSCGYEGILAIEYFVRQGEIYFNEMAPRPHNSGHYTIEGATTNQFRELVRYLVGQPLEEPRLVAPTVMKNILGQDLETAERIAREPHEGVFVHIYGKSESRPKRKMGHITFVGMTPERYEREWSDRFVR